MSIIFSISKDGLGVFSKRILKREYTGFFMLDFENLKIEWKRMVVREHDTTTPEPTTTTTTPQGITTTTTPPLTTTTTTPAPTTTTPPPVTTSTTTPEGTTTTTTPPPTSTTTTPSGITTTTTTPAPTTTTTTPQGTTTTTTTSAPTTTTTTPAPTTTTTTTPQGTTTTTTPAPTTTTTTVSPESIIVGSEYGGGTVFYIFAESDPEYEAGKVKGLIAHDTEIISSQNWSDAITACDNFSHEGYNDWYLGNRDRNSKMFESGVISYGLATYWTSEENTSLTDYAYYIHGVSGEIFQDLKTETRRYKPIRNFEVSL